MMLSPPPPNECPNLLALWNAISIGNASIYLFMLQTVLALMEHSPTYGLTSILEWLVRIPHPAPSSYRNRSHAG